mgnify:CR=1 FL=1
MNKVYLADNVKGRTKVRAARAVRFFFLIQPIRSLCSNVFIAVAVVLALYWWGLDKNR